MSDTGGLVVFGGRDDPASLAGIVALDALVFGEKTGEEKWLGKKDLRVFAESADGPAGREFVAYAAVYDDGDNWHLWKAGTRG